MQQGVYGRLTGEGTGIPHNDSEKGTGRTLKDCAQACPESYSGCLPQRKDTCRKPNTVFSNSGCRGASEGQHRVLALWFIFQTATKMASKVALCPGSLLQQTEVTQQQGEMGRPAPGQAWSVLTEAPHTLLAAFPMSPLGSSTAPK